ncbi:MAG: dCTP deaminase [Thermoproteota archaeon]|nr:MAG: dCTP deaminase [Candidatus Korarchaeota archaeon]RLG53127.1 MAG: dCTP deaminase [Candidatus Korarchaeota archaeon]
MILSDFDLRSYLSEGRLVIKPLLRDTIQQNGVDLHIGAQIAVPRDPGRPLDIGKDDPADFYRIEEIPESGYEIPPYTSVLLHTEEYVELPNDLMAICGLRSTFARLGFIAPTTYVDAGFRGELTIEVLWSKPYPIRVYRGIRFLHVVFSKCLNSVERMYSGEYQGQRGVTLPKKLASEVREASLLLESLLRSGSR